MVILYILRNMSEHMRKHVYLPSAVMCTVASCVSVTLYPCARNISAQRMRTQAMRTHGHRCADNSSDDASRYAFLFTAVVLLTSPHIFLHAPLLPVLECTSKKHFSSLQGILRNRLVQYFPIIAKSYWKENHWFNQSLA